MNWGLWQCDTVADQGLTSAGSNTDTVNSNKLSGSHFTTPSSPSAYLVRRICANVGTIDPTSANDKFALAIYSDSAGSPGSLLTYTGQGTLTANTTNCLDVHDTVGSWHNGNGYTLSGNTNYWIIYSTNGSTGSYNNLTYNTTSTSGEGIESGTYTFGSLPSTFPSGWTESTNQYALSVSYTP